MAKTDELTALRMRIDEIDDQLCDLFAARMALARQIATYKREQGLPVQHPGREQAVLNRLCARCDTVLTPHLKALYQTIFAVSRRYQEQLLAAAEAEPGKSGIAHAGSAAETEVNGVAAGAPVFGLLGETLTHSFSPRIHQLLGGYAYSLFALPPQQLGDFLTNRSFDGLNVTMPYKQMVIPYCDALSPAARRTGSVNTLLRRRDGKLYGDNTDYGGFSRLLEKSGVCLRRKKVLLLGGNGGAGHTVAAVAEDQGAAQVILVSRSGPVDYENVYRLHADAEVVINATPCGMYPQNAAQPIDLRRLPQCHAVLDLIYNPLRTRLVQQAQELGMITAGGLLMLVEQARLAAGLFLGRDLPLQRTQQVLAQLLAEMENIVLIGMPGAGKTSVGTALAEMLGRPFLDLDEEIRTESGRSPAQWITTYGEERFRGLEIAAAQALGKKQGLVIAAGGGTVLCKESMSALRQNGCVLYLSRALESLATAGRPLSQQGTALQQLQQERLPLYLQAARRTINNDTTIQAAAAAAAVAFQEVLHEDTGNQRTESEPAGLA